MSSEPVIALTRNLPSSAKRMLDPLGALRVPVADRPLEREELLAHVHGAQAVVSMLYDRVDGELLDAAGSQLAIVANVAVGHDNIDVAAAAERGVIVTNTPGVLDEATADVALALMLMATRKLPAADRFLREGGSWRWDLDFMLGSGLQGKTAGVVGLGRIGQAFARRCQALGMSIAYSGRRPAPAAVVKSLSANRLELDELFKCADVVSIHVPLDATTRHLVDAERLRLMKRSAYLINTARGEIVDEAALVDALQGERIAGAGLDVFEHEPEIHPGLLSRGDVVLLPHLGSATREVREGMSELAARNVKAVLGGGTAITAIDGQSQPREPRRHS